MIRQSVAHHFLWLVLLIARLHRHPTQRLCQVVAGAQRQHGQGRIAWKQVAHIVQRRHDPVGGAVAAAHQQVQIVDVRKLAQAILGRMIAINQIDLFVT